MKGLQETVREGGQRIIDEKAKAEAEAQSAKREAQSEERKAEAKKKTG